MTPTHLCFPSLLYISLSPTLLPSLSHTHSLRATEGLPDTAMNTLALGSCIGAISEKLQDSIQSYVKTNPDGAISQVMTER